ncbi:helix-turn-helix domain-containing protein [Nocardia uniformis]|uniref:Helix-turn-helix domain-containing protein n=1 Tax=Nocardia uniformis TaxID=53432 RepID=A0A849C881_9NOCA|nr:helix-turn-helix transcriptional regulator [Nocardia uniformis]NNH73948.1 helix-turn-helix domain-containing protein [Nocardia uniformis]
MTSAAHEAREALGIRLRELRRDAGLTGRRLAELAGWHESKTSRIEYGKQTPSEADLRAWCEHTDSRDHLPDLIATLRNLQAAYMEWRRILGTGTKRRQKVQVKLEAEARAMRWYEPSLVPGLLQTPAYIKEVLTCVIRFNAIPDDLEQGLTARIERQQVLYHGTRRFSFVIAEQVLQTTLGNDSVMLGQLDRLLSVMALPRVSIGIVPRRNVIEALAPNGFVIYDNRLVQAETVTAELSISQPREIALYGKLFTQLAAQAVYGEAARVLIQAEVEKRR